MRWVKTGAFAAPFALLFLAACKPPAPAAVPPGAAAPPAGMRKYRYLASDGGPHLLLASELSGSWKGVTSLTNPLDPATDYGRACAATIRDTFALIPIGSGQGIAIKDPPMTAWGRSEDGSIDIYLLEAWTSMDLDALIDIAVSSTPTASMSDTGKKFTLQQPGAILMFAGDQPSSTAYGTVSVPVPAGEYTLLEGHYKKGTSEEVFICRLRAAPVK